jgi:hypothetical protein
MYKISPSRDAQERTQGSIISLSNIRQSCMLIPVFPKPQSLEARNLDNWTPDNVLDEARSFHINNFLHLYTFQTLW